MRNTKGRERDREKGRRQDCPVCISIVYQEMVGREMVMTVKSVGHRHTRMKEKRLILKTSTVYKEILPYIQYTVSGAYALYNT